MPNIAFTRWRPGQLAVTLLDIPPSNAGSFGRQTKSLLGRTQFGGHFLAFRLSCLSLGDVLVNTDQTYGVSFLVTFDLTERRDPTYLGPGTNDAVFILVT